jgi:tetratricopeptide (TPR) repeat protein
VVGKYPLPVSGRTLVDAMRDDLIQCELLVSEIGHHRRTARAAASESKLSGDAITNDLMLLRLLDSVAEELERFEEQGADLRAERVRFENILNQLQSRDQIFVAEVGAALTTERPADARWWWYLDEQVAVRRQRRLKRAAGIVLAGAVLLTLLYVVYDRFLAAPPNVRQAVSLTFEAGRAVAEGDLQRAIEKYERALELDPGNVEAQLWLGILYEKTDDPERAAAALERARALFDSEVIYLLERGMFYLMVDDTDSAAQDAQRAIDIAPGQPEGYFLLGSVAEQVGDLQLARDSFEQASQLAEETGQVTLQVTARVRLAGILQRLMTVPQQ